MALRCQFKAFVAGTRYRNTCVGLGAALLASISGCSTAIKPVTQLHKEEVKLGTDDKDAQQFHALVYYPQEHALRYPGLIVGIEKSGAKLIKDEAKSLLIQPTASSGTSAQTNEWLEKLMKDDWKSMFISHVVESTDRLPVKLLHNAYECKTKELGNTSDISCGEFGSWNAIEAVRAKLKEELKSGKFSHVVFLTMGWNTNQIEAVQNYNSLVRELKAEATRLQQHFAPYVVGVTWPSQWDSGWFGDAYRGSSLINKANDADEIGAGWLGAVLGYGVLSETRASGTKVIVIGHSFGARAASHAVCRGTLLQPPMGLFKDLAQPVKGDVQWLINLQGAYSLNRFSTKGAGLIEKISYDPKCEVASNLLFTASQHDSAAANGHSLLGAPFAGSIGTWNRLIDEPDDRAPGAPSFELYKTYKSQSETEKVYVCLAGKAGSDTRPFKYVDADEVIKLNAYGTGAGAHSDIYRDETAKLMWKFMSTAPIRKCP